MTLRTNARVAGLTFLLYIAFAFPAMVLFGKATRGEETPAKLAALVEHAGDVRIVILLSVLCGFCALLLAVTLYALTRDVDADLARFAMLCRVVEGTVTGPALLVAVSLAWLAATGRAGRLDPVSGNTLAAFLLQADNLTTLIGSTFFAVGSTVFAWLFLRGRLIPVWLAWLGVIGSALAALVMPLQLAGLVRGLLTQVIWLPVAVFEIVLAFRLILKGTAAPVPR